MKFLYSPKVFVVGNILRLLSRYKSLIELEENKTFLVFQKFFSNFGYAKKMDVQAHPQP